VRSTRVEWVAREKGRPLSGEDLPASSGSEKTVPDAPAPSPSVPASTSGRVDSSKNGTLFGLPAGKKSPAPSLSHFTRSKGFSNRSFLPFAFQGRATIGRRTDEKSRRGGGGAFTPPREADLQLLEAGVFPPQRSVVSIRHHFLKLCGRVGYLLRKRRWAEIV
jgi:hypothetical protein